MEKISAWKVFKLTTAISAGIGIGKRIIMAADAALVHHIKKKFPEVYENVLNESKKKGES